MNKIKKLGNKMKVVYHLPDHSVTVHYNEHKEVIKIEGIPGDLTILSDMGLLKRVKISNSSLLGGADTFIYYVKV